jgi:hypothetical protein
MDDDGTMYVADLAHCAVVSLSATGAAPIVSEYENKNLRVLYSRIAYVPTNWLA